jgi:anti-repressor protein
MQNNENFAENPNFEDAPLIRVELNEEGKQVVSARELYTFLEVNAQFTDWCQRMFEYGFVEKRDYVGVFHKNVKNPQGGRPSVDYALTIDCAKHIAMIQRSDKGRQIREYFLWCEKNLQNSAMLFVHQLLYEQDKALTESEITMLKQVTQEMYHIVLDFQTQQNTMRLEIKQLQRAVIDACKEILRLKGQIEFTAQWLEEVNQMVEELTKFYGLPVECFVYVFFNPQNGLYKIGRSNNVGTRKKGFETVQNGLKLVFAIPTRTFKEAVALEKTLQSRFVEQVKFGEWYALVQKDLHFLKVMQDAHREDIVNSDDFIH